MIDWVEVYKDAIKGQVVVAGGRASPDAKPCRVIPCPGSYFPAHDERCEMVWDMDAARWTDCACEPRARERRDAGQV